MSEPADISESVLVDAPPAQVYAAVSTIRRMREWSPEVIGAWVRGDGGVGTRFVGWNRRRGWVWFTLGRVTVAAQDRDFAFSVSVFGMPIAQWGYTIEPAGDGTRLTEHWHDLRTGRSGPVMKVLGLLATGVRAGDRPAVNRAGMRATLEAIRDGVTAPPA